MKAHNWVLKESDYGHLGVLEYWECSRCSSNGGGLITDDDGIEARDRRNRGAFWDSAPNVVGPDCDLAIQKIDAWIRESKCGWWRKLEKTPEVGYWNDVRAFVWSNCRDTYDYVASFCFNQGHWPGCETRPE